MKTSNPHLRVLLSLGGNAIKSEVFETITSSKSLSVEVATNVATYLQANTLDGVELNWQWPGTSGGSKSRDGLTRFTKVSFAVFVSRLKNKLVQLGLHHCLLSFSTLSNHLVTN